jgi:hypothetical protein
MFVGSGDDDLILHAGGFLSTNIAATISGTTQTFAIAKAATVGGTLGVTGATTFGNTVTLNADPAANLQAATKQYVDQKASTGLSYHAAVQAATTQSLAAQTGGLVVYNNGVSGVGATITLSVALTALDGYSLANTNRILVKDESNQTYNGVYTWATGGTVLTRATDADTAGGGANELSLNDYFYVQNGTVNKGIAYVISAPATTIVFGTSNITFAEFSSAQIYTGTSPINVSSTVISLTTVPATLGGTGTSTVTTGDLLYGSGTNTWSKLSKGSAYQPLVMNAGGTNVEWNAVALNQSNAVSGTLGATNGGTGLNTYTLGDTVYSSAANTLSKLSGNITTTKKFLVQTGTGAASAAPAWDVVNGADVNGNISGSAGSVANALTAGTYLISAGTYNGAAARTFSVDATDANTASKVVARDASGNFSAGTITATLSGNATNVSGTVAIANGGSGTTTAQGAMNAFAGAVTSGSYLRGNGSNVVMSTIQAADVPTLNQNTTGNATTATTATNLAGGSAGTIPYQSAAGTTVQLTAGTSGYLLQANGAAAPSWVAPAAVNNGTLTMAVSGTGLSGSATFTANQSGASSFTVTSNATNANTASTIVARDASGNFSAGTITATLSGNASTATSATSATSATTATTATTANALNTVNNYQVNSLGIGTAASGTAGEIRATNNVTAYYSDDRLKNRLGKIENALDKLCSLDGFYYEANEIAQALGYTVQREAGVSAQQMQAVLPEIVVPAPIDEKYLTVRYDRALPLLIEAIKQLREEVREIKKAVEK